jgi:hypothetical protein
MRSIPIRLAQYFADVLQASNATPACYTVAKYLHQGYATTHQAQ